VHLSYMVRWRGQPIDLWYLKSSEPSAWPMVSSTQMLSIVIGSMINDVDLREEFK
jgi:hypothetical protein